MKWITTFVWKTANKPDEFSRIFSTNVLGDAVSKYSKFVDRDVAFGETKSPNDDLFNATVSLQNTSHKISNVLMYHDDVIVTIETLETPKGIELFNYLVSPLFNVVFRARMVGTQHVDKNVLSDVEIISFDAIVEKYE